MSKTTYVQRFEKVSKFYDNSYHHHKATYKGFSQFFKSYCAIEKDYANQVLKLSEGVNGFIIDFATELPYIQQGIKQVCGNLQRVSQLHFNYGERLREIGEFCKEEYNISKRNKQKFMKLNFQKSQEDYEKVKESKNRNMLNQKEKQICKKLYLTIDQFMQDEVNRTQKLKEQLIIYFSLTKKIAEKELQLAGAYSIKMAQFEIQVKIPQVYEIQDMLIDQFNSYGQQKIQKKMRDISQQISVHRQSLRDSIQKKEKITKIEDYQSKMQTIMQKLQQIPQELNYPNEEDTQIGLFDKAVFPNYRLYTRQFKSQAIRQLSYVLLSSFYADTNDDEIKSFLMIIKTNLKIKNISVQKIKDIPQFVEVYSQKPEYKWIIYFLVQLSQLYDGTITMKEFNLVFTNRKLIQSSKRITKPLHWKIFIVILDVLLQSIIIIRDGYSLLYDQYIEILRIINNFSKTIFHFDPNIPVLMLLSKLQRALSTTNSTDEEIIEQIFLTKLQSGNEQQYTQTQSLKTHIGHRVINFLTDKMTKFYNCQISFNNLIKLSLCLQKYLPKNYFTAVDHMHKCIKIAGFNFFVESDEDKKVVEGGIWRGEERLKNLTSILEEIEYDKIKENYFEPISRNLSKLIGVGYQVILTKMLKEFYAPMCQIINCNLSIISEQEGIDRQGYVLRLGICLAQLDLQQPQDIKFYDSYFQVLETYLTATEKDYDNLLEHSRKTQLWIVEENSQATQNCIDFCSMLYKPFEFLLSSLKKLEERNVQTQFTRKYDQFIKIKLNNALKGQIQKYVKFLIDSLNGFNSREPQLLIKPKRVNEVISVSNDELIKERYSFREMTRRLYNLIFLKDQLDEIVCDFIDKGVYQEIDFSIFNLVLLEKVSGKSTSYHDLLSNIYQIATLISNTETKLVSQIASTSIYHFLKRLFANIYFQEEKGFFSANQYRLSQHTFQKYENDIEQILLTMSRNIPAESIDTYSKEVCTSLFKAFRCQALNIHKFKIGLSQESIINYLKGDFGFVCNLLKKKFFDASFVRDCLEEPSKILFKDMEKNSQKLMESFSQSSLKNNNQEARYYLALLNIRKEEKAEEFVQRYKKMLK